jgi:hypothetical protein
LAATDIEAVQLVQIIIRLDRGELEDLALGSSGFGTPESQGPCRGS